MAQHTAPPTEHYLVARVGGGDPAAAAGALLAARAAASAAGGTHVSGVELRADQPLISAERTLITAVFDAILRRARRSSPAVPAAA